MSELGVVSFPLTLCLLAASWKDQNIIFLFSLYIILKKAKRKSILP